VLLLNVARSYADTACIGFTGPRCDRSYSATALGMHCANQDAPKNASSEMLVAATPIRMGEPVFCDDDEFRAYLKDGRNWLPWNRHYDRIWLAPLQSIYGQGFHADALAPR
jgi:hypothetical protein